MSKVSIEISDEIAVVTVDNPPVNALSHLVRTGLAEAIQQTETNPEIVAVVLICTGRTFIAGADVREFNKPAKPPHLPDLIEQLEDVQKPWVAALHGTALGGGLEVALGCRHRMATTDARFGLPEVNLGLIPGAGGSVRLPRLIGPEAALDMIAGGRQVAAQKALEIGLIDEIASGDLLAKAIKLARQVAQMPLAKPIICLPIKQPESQAEWLATKTAIKNRARGQLSPLAAIEVVENAFNLPAQEALSKEREIFLTLKKSPQSAAMRHIFFAERSVSKIAELKGIAPRKLDQIGVIGGGTMGAGIAAACLLAGLFVTMVERDQSSLQAGLERVFSILENSRSRGLINAQKHDVMKSALTGELDYKSLSQADLIIEAVFEDMAVKNAVLTQIDAVAHPDAVFATNTSYLDVGELASSLADPSRLIGLHFFSPAHIMKLLEIVRPPQLDSAVLATGFAFAKRLGKIAVPAGVCDGFIANRMMSSYRREADYMVEDGAWPQDVDAAMVEFGFPMGIFAMQDMAGLDIGWATRKRQAATRPKSMRYVDIADRICEMGRFGRKTGQGWYDYSDEKTGKPDPAIEQLILEESKRKGIKRIRFSTDEIMGRMISTMQSEGRAILDEGIASSSQAIDVVMVNGYGFPRWRGGPMYMKTAN